METCRAAVITEHNKPLTIEQVPIPKLDQGSLLVKITASTLCGTDVHRWHGPLGDEDSLQSSPATNPAVTSKISPASGPISSATRSNVVTASSGVTLPVVLVITARLRCNRAFARAARPGDITAAISIRFSSAAVLSICTCRKNVSSSKFPKMLLPRLRRRLLAPTAR